MNLKKLTFVVGQFRNETKKVRAKFRYNRVDYNLCVTDTAIEEKYKGKAVGEYPFDKRVLLTISLGNLFEDYYYKLVAGIVLFDE